MNSTTEKPATSVQTPATIFHARNDLDFLTIEVIVPSEGEIIDEQIVVTLDVNCVLHGDKPLLEHHVQLGLKNPYIEQLSFTNQTFKFMDSVHEALGLRAPANDVAFITNIPDTETNEARWVIFKKDRQFTRSHMSTIENFYMSGRRDRPACNVAIVKYGNQEVALLDMFPTPAMFRLFILGSLL